MAIEPISCPPSRNIAWVNYDADAQLMTVGFQKGAVYQYFDVPGDVAHGFSQALDASDYLKTFVTNSFQYERIG